MSRLLKDCMNSCCCGKKQDNICDVIDDLGSVVKSIDCAKKIAKEIEKAKKELRAESEETLEKLLNKINREKWVIGEYKWMPVGSRMPEGWVKVDIGQGQTLVQGEEAGKTVGSLLRHNHLIPDNRKIWTILPDQEVYWKNAPKPSAGVEENEFMVYVKHFGAISLYKYVEYTGSDSNLAAGKFAELWQFKGVDCVRKQLKKCLENSIEESLNKCLEKK